LKVVTPEKKDEKDIYYLVDNIEEVRKELDETEGLTPEDKEMILAA